MRLAALALIVVLIALAFAGCGSKCGNLPGTVATVNGKAISCSDFANLMSARMGRDVLGSMIEQNVVTQWAENEGVAPTDAQIEKQAALLKDEGQYDDQLKAMGEDAMKSEMRSVQSRINLAKKYIKFTDKEIEQAYNSMKLRFVRGPRKYVAVIVNPDKAKLEEAEKALKDGKDFDVVAQQYSDRRVAARPPIKTWVVEGQAGMPPALQTAAKDTKDGQVSGIVSLSQPGGQGGTNLILKVLISQGAANKKLSDVREDVADALVLQKSQYDPDFVKKLNEKLKSAKIEVNIPQFKDLTEQYKNMPEPMPMMPGMAPGPR